MSRVPETPEEFAEWIGMYSRVVSGSDVAERWRSLCKILGFTSQQLLEVGPEWCYRLVGAYNQGRCDVENEAIARWREMDRSALEWAKRSAQKRLEKTP